ncbi:uncharacterized protein LOC122646583 isoform X2 [Telopea speciosissima]|uniref:uncharacterized protein LOC122646583 isoform X2 n=1 Tax=Telopea speciosissima TaxID=54955 RepID=UPI001CC52457|nr:uncharacterized protein LOC122646583 isoform X2 [Telopea speciosissima]
MASPSTWRRSWRTTSDPAFNFSSSGASSVFSLSFCRRIRETHITKFSLDNSSMGNSNPELPPASIRKGSEQKPVQIGKSADVIFLLPADDDSPVKLKSSNSIAFEEKAKKDSPSASSRKKSSKSLKSLASRPLWRRILFASKKFRSIILLNVITIVYASNIPVLKEVEGIMDPSLFTLVRFSVSAIPFLPFVLRARDDVQTRTAGIELGFWVSMGYLMQALGLLTSEAGRASFLSLFTVIIVPLLDGMLGATVPARTWFGALMSIVGITMLESSGSPPSVGDLLNFLSAVFFGIHMLRTEHISRSTEKKNFLPLLGYQVCVIALFSTIWYFISVWLGGSQELDPTSLTWSMVWDWMVVFPWIPALYTGVFTTGLSLWVEMAAMRDVSATDTAIIYGLEPLWGAGFAWFLLGERWGTAGWIGAALILGGSLMVQILGSTTTDRSKEHNSGQSDHILSIDKRNGFIASPVVVSSKKSVPDLSKKKK